MTMIIITTEVGIISGITQQEKTPNKNVLYGQFKEFKTVFTRITVWPKEL